MGAGAYVCALAVGALAFVAVATALGAVGTVAGYRPAVEGVAGRLAAQAQALPWVRAARARAALALGRDKALRDMPTLLDVVTLGLQAGLSFDASLELYCERYAGVLPDACSEAMLSWRLGLRGRDDALMELAERLDVVALRRFASAVGQALAFGSPLAAVLEHQAQAIRDEQRAQLEAEIERVPVKMLIPLGTLIVPAMLLSILGPLVGSAVTLG